MSAVAAIDAAVAVDTDAVGDLEHATAKGICSSIDANRSGDDSVGSICDSSKISSRS